MKQTKIGTLLILLFGCWIALPSFAQDTPANRLLCQEMVQSPPNFAKIKQLIGSGADINCQCETLRRIEFLASDQAITSFYAPSVTEYTLTMNSSPSAIIEHLYVSPMQIALAREDYALLRFLISSGVNLNHSCCDGLKPLEYALHANNQDLAEFLIRMGASPREMSIGCPINIELARFFIYRGADPTTIRIDCALHNKKQAEALIRLNPDFKGSNLTNYSFNKLIEKPKLLEFLLVNNFSANGFNNSIEKRTLLSLAAEQGNESIIDLLLKFNVEIDLADGEGLTPLCYAVMNNHSTITEKLIRSGALVNVKIHHASVKTPLSFAVKQQNYLLSKLLLEYGADIKLSTEDVLKAAVQADNQEMIALLVNYGASTQRLVELYGSDYLFKNAKTFEFIVGLGALSNGDNFNFALRAVKEGKEDVAAVMIEHQTGLSNIDDDGKSPLHYAFEQKNYSLAYQLIDNGANVNQEIQGFESFLHRAVREQNLVMVHKLLQNEADMAALNTEFVTALHIAIENKSIDIAKILVRKNSPIECEDLFEAIHKEHFSMVKLLVENDADLTCATSNGRSLVQFAKRNNISYQIPQYLKGKVPRK